MSSSGKGRFLSWYKHGMTNLEAFQPPALRPHFRLLTFYLLVLKFLYSENDPVVVACYQLYLLRWHSSP